MMRMTGLPQVLERLECVLCQALVQRTPILGAETKRILPSEVVKVPVNKAPIESVVVGNEELPAGAVFLQ